MKMKGLNEVTEFAANIVILSYIGEDVEVFVHEIAFSSIKTGRISISTRAFNVKISKIVVGKHCGVSAFNLRI